MMNDTISEDLFQVVHEAINIKLYDHMLDMVSTLFDKVILVTKRKFKNNSLYPYTIMGCHYSPMPLSKQWI